MADAYKLLYQGQLAASVGVLATVPGSKSWIVRHISIVNNDTVDRTCALYRGGAVAANLITPPAVVVKAGGMVEFDGAMALNTGETIQGVGSVATMLTTTIDGDEVT